MSPEAASMIAVRSEMDALHEEIRARIAAVLELARRVRQADASAAMLLTRAMRDLASSVRRHVVAEERDLASLLGALGPDVELRGPLALEHTHELEAVLGVDYYRSHGAMAEDARSVALRLEAALATEETLLRA
jgi:hypothetical protein